MKHVKKTFINNLLISFVNGIVILFPLFITVWIVSFLVNMLNNTILEPLLKLLSFVQIDIPHELLAKGIILVIVILGVGLIGWAAHIIVVRRFFSKGESVFLKLPVMGRIYNAVKQIVSAFTGKGKTVFNRVVLVEYPRKGLYSVGFAAGTSGGELERVAGGGAVNVFIPTSPNPTSGMFVVVPSREVHFIDMSVEEGMKLIISGGAYAVQVGKQRDPENKDQSAAEGTR